MNKFLKEILEQPEALRKTLAHYTDGEGGEALNTLAQTMRNGQFEQVIFTGMGSSYFTSFAAVTLLAEKGISASVINTSELLHYRLPVLSKKTLLFCISQSGESYEIVELLSQLPRGVVCVGITNEPGSTLGRKADIVLQSLAGSEEMTSTKTYVSILMIVFILGWHLAGEWHEKGVISIREMAEGVAEDLRGYEKYIDDALAFLGDLPSLQVIARGPVIATAMQSALMFKEAVKVPAAAYLGGEFRHGPMEMVQEGLKCIVFAPEGKTREQSVKMARDIARFGGRVLLINSEQEAINDKNLMQITIPERDEYLFSIRSVIPLQLMVDRYAKARGFEAGSFSHGAKVTSTE